MSATQQVHYMTVSLEPHVWILMEVSLVPVQLVLLEMAERVDLVVRVRLTNKQ